MKKKIVFFMIMIFTLSICHTSNLTADDGHWAETNIFPTTFNWGDSGNWINGVIAGGAGATAYFTNGIIEPHDGNPKGILMGSNPTLENLYVTLDNAQPPASSIIIASGTITLEGSPVVTVVGAPNFHGFYIGAAGAGYGGVLAGTDGFTKEGDGKLYLQGDNTISGTLNHKNGNIWLDWPTAAQSLDVIVNSNAILTAAYGTNNVKSITVNNGGILETYNIPSKIVSPSIIIKSNGYLNIANYFDVVISGSDITVEKGGSVYCGVAQYFTINNNLTLEGNGHHGGAIEVWNTVAYGTYNGTNTLAGDTRVFQHGADGEMIFNGPFTGTNAASLEMIGQGADPTHTKTFYLNAQNTHNGPTTLSTFACGTFYEIGINDCFPTNQPLNFYIYHWSQDVGMSVNMFEYTQNIPSLNLFCGENLDSIELLGDLGSKLSVEENVNQSGGIAKINTCELEIGGALTVNGTMLGMSNVTFLSGASISGTGTVDKLTIPSSVTVSPGNSIGTLNIISNLTMETGSIINWEVGDPGLADLININGSFTVPAGGMTVNAIDAGFPEGTYTIVQTSDGIIGDASNITMNYNVGVEGDTNPTINGNSLEVNIIPEPFLFIIYYLSFTIYYIRKRK
jgi:autotransporter-associated beta strand protein